MEELSHLFFSGIYDHISLHILLEWCSDGHARASRCIRLAIISSIGSNLESFSSPKAFDHSLLFLKNYAVGFLGASAHLIVDWEVPVGSGIVAKDG